MDKIIKIVATGLSVSAIFLYFVGNSLWGSVLSHFGIHLEIFPKTIEEYITYGYDMLNVAYAENFISLLVFLFLAILTITVLLDFIRTLLPNLFSKQNKKINNNHFFLNTLRRYSVGLFTVILIVITPFFMVFFSMQDKVMQFIDYDQNKSTTIIVTKIENIENIKIIAMNNSYCAYSDGNNTNIIHSHNIVKIISRVGK